MKTERTAAPSALRDSYFLRVGAERHPGAITDGSDLLPGTRVVLLEDWEADSRLPGAPETIPRGTGGTITEDDCAYFELPIEWDGYAGVVKTPCRLMRLKE